MINNLFTDESIKTFLEGRIGHTLLGSNPAVNTRKNCSILMRAFPESGQGPQRLHYISKCIIFIEIQDNSEFKMTLLQ